MKFEVFSVDLNEIKSLEESLTMESINARISEARNDSMYLESVDYNKSRNALLLKFKSI